VLARQRYSLADRPMIVAASALSARPLKQFSKPSRQTCPIVERDGD